MFIAGAVSGLLFPSACWGGGPPATLSRALSLIIGLEGRVLDPMCRQRSKMFAHRAHAEVAVAVRPRPRGPGSSDNSQRQAADTQPRPSIRHAPCGSSPTCGRARARRRGRCRETDGQCRPSAGPCFWHRAGERRSRGAARRIRSGRPIRGSRRRLRGWALDRAWGSPLLCGKCPGTMDRPKDSVGGEYPIAPGRAHADRGSAGGGVSELPIDCGPGYRVYFVFVDRELAVLLAGGNKSTPAA